MDASVKFKSFGLPYQGSKKKIAEALVSKMPSCECFVDLFAGGCSVSHIAALSGKYERLIINDLSPSAQDWLAVMSSVLEGDPFRYVCYISRDRFENDCGINTLLWAAFAYSHLISHSYYISKKYEETGKEFFNDVFSREVLKNGDLIQAYSRYRQIAPCYTKIGVGYESIPRPTQAILNCLMTMQAHPVRLDSMHCSIKPYDRVQIPDGSCIYCGIPYYGVAGYNVSFCHRDFYSWASSVAKAGCAVFISEYRMPSEFREVLSIPVSGSVCGLNKKYRVHEKLFTI